MSIAVGNGRVVCLFSWTHTIGAGSGTSSLEERRIVHSRSWKRASPFCAGWSRSTRDQHCSPVGDVQILLVRLTNLIVYSIRLGWSCATWGVNSDPRGSVSMAWGGQVRHGARCGFSWLVGCWTCCRWSVASRCWTWPIMASSAAGRASGSCRPVGPEITRDQAASPVAQLRPFSASSSSGGLLHKLAARCLTCDTGGHARRSSRCAVRACLCFGLTGESRPDCGRLQRSAGVTGRSKQG